MRDDSRADSQLWNAAAVSRRNASDPGKVKRALDRANRFAANGRFDMAITHYETALSLNPDNVDAHNNLGNVYVTLGDATRAAMHYQSALAIDPSYVEAHNNLGNILMRSGRVKQALEHYQEAAARRPELPEAHNNLGLAHASLGEADAACASFERAFSLKPDYSAAHSNMLLSLNYFPDIDSERVYGAHTDFAKLHESILKENIIPWKNERSPERRLKIGYISSDFRDHSVAWFFHPVLANHDHEQIEVFCYSNHPRDDAVTQRLATKADHWRRIFGAPDERVAEQIRRDGIDILVDLNGHTAMNRLLVFARKPAPIQITWLGYPNTTGLTTMNYRITDKYADPPGGTEAYHSEKLLRLPDCFSCYEPPEDSPAPSEPPVNTKGYITFGSFNKINKINPSVVAAWSRILQSIPNARLKLKTAGFGDPAVREMVCASFSRYGITADRLELLGHAGSRKHHLAQYQSVDIALDTFPYNGTTTTCEALWMGVPVVTLAGKVHAGRVGVSQLNSLELPELIAETMDEYIAIATRLASDRAHLNKLRMDLRNRMSRSPLTDAKNFTANLEHAYRGVWRAWCENHSP